MTLYRGYWPDRSEQEDYKIPSLPKFKQGDIIIFEPRDLILVWEHVYLVLEIKQESLFVCLNEHQNIIPFIPTNFYKYEII